jgi:exosortase
MNPSNPINPSNSSNPNSSAAEKKHSINKTSVRFLILLVLSLAAFIPVYPMLVWTWLNHSDNSHGILVPLVSAYFIWQKKKELQLSEISNFNWGGVILAISMGLYLLSYAGGVAVVSRAMIVSSLVGLVMFTLGKEIFSLLAFPLLYLFFMVPVPDSILGLVALPLQLFATKVSTFLIHAVSIPAYREGNMLYFAQTHLEVAEACSGIRSIMSFGMLSFIFAYMMDRVWWKRIFIVLSTIPLALIANIVRVTGTGILAHFYGAKFALGFLHEFSGLVVFAFGFVLLLGEFILLNKVRGKP